jgi:hypothetical protein
VSNRAIATAAIGLFVLIAGLAAVMVVFMSDCADKTSLYDPACSDGRGGTLAPVEFGDAALVAIPLAVLVAAVFVCGALQVLSSMDLLAIPARARIVAVRRRLPRDRMSGKPSSRRAFGP